MRGHVFGCSGRPADRPPDIVVASQMVNHFELINPRWSARDAEVHTTPAGGRERQRKRGITEREREIERERGIGRRLQRERSRQCGQSANINSPLIYYNLGLLCATGTERWNEQVALKMARLRNYFYLL